MSVSPCCLQGFEWSGKPTGQIGKLASNDAYITGNNPDAAILIVHDLFGWKFPNVRLLADHYAREANATVYVPDFFGGEGVSLELLLAGKYEQLDLPTFMGKNSREVREPEMFECARALKGKFKKVGAIGFCYGGWAVFRLGAKEHDPPIVDVVAAGHPTYLTKKDVDEVNVPVQMLAPEFDPVYSPEMKSYTFETILKKGLPFVYQHFPGVEHACFSRGDQTKPGEREAMVRGKNAMVWWMAQFLHELPGATE